MAPDSDPLLRSIVSWAAGRPDVRAVLLTGSRSAEAGTGDAVSDFDVDLLVDDPRAFGDDDWLERIAPVLIASEDDEDEDGDPVRLVFFSAQRKVEFRLRDAARTSTAETPGEVLFTRADGGAGPEAGAGPVGAHADTGPAADDDQDADPVAAAVAEAADAAAALVTLDGEPDAPGPAVLLALLPVFTAPDVPAWLAHYRALGFAVQHGDDGTGVALRDGLVLRVVADPDAQPASRGLVLAVVDDPDELAREWSAVPGGRTTASGGDGPRRWTHVDPAGNVLRFGAPG